MNVLFQSFLATQLFQALAQPWLPLSSSGDLVSLLPQALGVHKACRSAEVVSCRAQVSKPPAGRLICRSKTCGQKAFSLPNQEIAILSLVVLSW